LLLELVADGDGAAETLADGCDDTVADGAGVAVVVGVATLSAASAE
jgi:hypothetical protein